MKFLKTISLVLCSLAITQTCNLTAIAKYKALQLKELKNTSQPTTGSYISFAFKQFTKADCHKYLGRNTILSKGIQPVQIQFTNNSEYSYILSADSFSFPCIPYQEVAECVSFNTAKRLTLWGIGTLFIWPLVIPFVIEAIESPKANERLETDFQNKSLDFTVVGPHQTVNKLVFVEKSEFSEHFSFSVVNMKNNEKLAVSTISPLIKLN